MANITISYQYDYLHVHFVSELERLVLPGEQHYSVIAIVHRHTWLQLGVYLLIDDIIANFVFPVG